MDFSYFIEGGGTFPDSSNRLQNPPHTEVGQSCDILKSLLMKHMIESFLSVEISPLHN